MKVLHDSMRLLSCLTGLIQPPAGNITPDSFYFCTFARTIHPLTSHLSVGSVWLYSLSEYTNTVLLGLLPFLVSNRFPESKGARIHNSRVDFITLKPEPTF